MLRGIQGALVVVLVAGGLSLLGCQSADEGNQGQENMNNTSTTMPSQSNNQQPHDSSYYYGTDNSSIGNGAFGEPTPP